MKEYLLFIKSIKALSEFKDIKIRYSSYLDEINE